jgi:hypothetical protein
VIGPYKFGSPARIRTADPVVNSHLLCQLSYWGISLAYVLTPCFLLCSIARWLIPPLAGLCQLSYWGISLAYVLTPCFLLCSIARWLIPPAADHQEFNELA